MSDDIKSRSSELIINKNIKSPAAEAYRTLRTNLRFINPDNSLDSILLTSSGAGVGKSAVSSNLAAAIAYNNQKVILVDADLREPAQHKFYEMTNYEGLSNILMGEISLAKGIRDSGVENLQIITSGIIPPNPAEMLDSKRMQNILSELEDRADLVILDTPPVVAVTDAIPLSRWVAGVLLVVASGQTHRDMLKKTVETLSQVKANIVGTVLNKYPMDSKKEYFGNYYYENI